MKYIWQSSHWPNFTWNSEKILKNLADAKKAQGYIQGQAQYLQLQDRVNILEEEVFSTSAIEGEKLDKNSIRSSVARRLGLPTAGITRVERNIDGVVAVLIDATMKHDSPLKRRPTFKTK